MVDFTKQIELNLKNFLIEAIQIGEQGIMGKYSTKYYEVYGRRFIHSLRFRHIDDKRSLKEVNDDFRKICVKYGVKYRVSKKHKGFAPPDLPELNDATSEYYIPIFVCNRDIIKQQLNRISSNKQHQIQQIQQELENNNKVMKDLGLIE